MPKKEVTVKDALEDAMYLLMKQQLWEGVLYNNTNYKENLSIKEKLLGSHRLTKSQGDLMTLISHYNFNTLESIGIIVKDSVLKSKLKDLKLEKEVEIDFNYYLELQYNLINYLEKLFVNACKDFDNINQSRFQTLLETTTILKKDIENYVEKKPKVHLEKVLVNLFSKNQKPQSKKQEVEVLEIKEEAKNKNPKIKINKMEIMKDTQTKEKEVQNLGYVIPSASVEQPIKVKQQKPNVGIQTVNKKPVTKEAPYHPQGVLHQQSVKVQPEANQIEEVEAPTEPLVGKQLVKHKQKVVVKEAENKEEETKTEAKQTVNKVRQTTKFDNIKLYKPSNPVLPPKVNKQ